MLEGLRMWRSGVGNAAAVACPGFADVEDRRRAERRDLTGAELFIFLSDNQRFRLRLRDACSTGLSGLSDAPLEVGETVLVQFEEMLMPAAQVMWTRRALAGMQFINPISDARLRHLCARHAAGAAWSPAMRAGSDLHCWWTDLESQQKERKPRLRAGGHKKPLPR